MSLVPIDEVVKFDARFHDPSTGALSDADSTPTFDVFEEDTDTPILAAQNMTKRTGLTGRYRGSFTASAANGFEAGKWYTVDVSGAVGGVSDSFVAAWFRVAPAEVSAGVPEVNVRSLTNGVIAAATFASNALDAVWSTATRLLTAGTNIALAKGTGVTGFNDLDAAGVRSAVGLSSPNLDTQLAALPTAGENADAVWEEALADHEGTAGSTAEALADAGGSGASAADIADAVLDEALSGHTTAGTLGKAVSDTAAAVDTEVAAIKAKTDQLTFTTANKVDARADLLGTQAKADVNAEADTALADYDGPTNAELATALASADDAVLAAISALNNLSAANVKTQVDAALDETVADSIPADGSRPSVRQALYILTQFLLEREVSGTTLTVKKPNGSTALLTLTLNDATTPTSVTRST